MSDSTYYQRNAEVIRAKARARYQRYKATGFAREQDLRAKFGISLAEYDDMFAAQKGRCAICGKPETAKRNGVVKRLAVDHDHNTGQIRGLLCGRCNPMIGYAQDDPEVLTLGAMYLRRQRSTDKESP